MRNLKDKKIINHIGSKTLTSSFIDYSLQLLKIEIGVKKNPGIRFRDLGILGYSILGSFSLEIYVLLKIALKPPEQLLPDEIREGDTTIMLVLYSLGYSKRDLIRINRVRNFLRVLYIYVSDIVEGNGKKGQK